MKKFIMLIICVLLVSCSPMDSGISTIYNMVQVTVGSLSGETINGYGFVTREDFRNEFIQVMHQYENLDYSEQDVDNVIEKLDNMLYSNVCPDEYIRDAMINNNLSYLVIHAPYGMLIIHWSKNGTSINDFSIEIGV